MEFITQLPKTQEERDKKQATLTFKRKALSTLCFIGAIAGIALLIGMLITLFMAELGDYGNDTKMLLYILTGSFGGAAVALALLAVLLSRMAQNALLVESDFIEQCDGENSFFVGEGTLATLGDGKVCLHSSGDGKTVFVPYEDLRLFSVCSRTRPSEKGEWSVLLEIPAKYLTKSGRDDGEKALVQTDAKPRLYECLKREGLPLIGEEYDPKPEKKKYTFVKKYVRPDKQKRSRALLFLILGAAAFVAGVPVAIWWEITIGSVLSVLGAFVLGRAIFSYAAARGQLTLYREGMWWSDHKNRSASVFLKWEEVESAKTEETENGEILSVHCAYGDYHFPAFDGAVEEIASLRNEAVKKEE